MNVKMPQQRNYSAMIDIQSRYCMCCDTFKQEKKKKSSSVQKRANREQVLSIIYKYNLVPQKREKLFIILYVQLIEESYPKPEEKATNRRYLNM